MILLRKFAAEYCILASKQALKYDSAAKIGNKCKDMVTYSDICQDKTEIIEVIVLQRF